MLRSIGRVFNRSPGDKKVVGVFVRFSCAASAYLLAQNPAQLARRLEGRRQAAGFLLRSAFPSQPSTNSHTNGIYGILREAVSNSSQRYGVHRYSPLTTWREFVELRWGYLLGRPASQLVQTRATPSNTWPPPCRVNWYACYFRCGS
jgi:hypothetical protein